MPRPETDPVKLGVAAGSSSDPFQLGLSDKAAKDFSKAQKSIETTSKLGGWGDMQRMAEKFLEITGLFKPFETLADVAGAMVTAETADSVALIYKEVFTEENMEEMRGQIKVFGDGVHVVVKGMIDMRVAFHDWLDDVEKGYLDMEVWRLKWLESWEPTLMDIDRIGKETGEAIINSVIEGITNALPGGGGGGGGDDDTPWWPFD